MILPGALHFPSCQRANPAPERTAMVDLVITAASVVVADVSGAIIEHLYAFETLAAGKVVYVSDATGRVGLADNNAGAAEVRRVRGIALNAASAGQPVAVLRSGDLTVGAAVVAGVAYYLSDVPGGICPVADLLTGEYPTVLGIAISSTVLRMAIQAAGVALA